MTDNVSVRDLPAEDFPMSIYAHTNPHSVGASWVWAVTVLRPPSGTRVALHVPSLTEFGPVYVTTRFASEGGVSTTGPYGEFVERPTFRCPRCGMVSAHPTDIEHGYCGNCHDWTSGDSVA